MNKTIYINTENETRIAGIKLGPLVNELLTKHFDGPLVTQTKKVTEILATPTTFETKLNNLHAAAEKYCKAGHLLPPGRDRCTQKGCKNA